MKMIKTLSCLFLILFISSCNEKKERVEFYENGKIKSRSWVNKNGNVDGTLIEYYEDGKIKSEGEWSDGRKSGIFKSYYENGRLSKIHELRDDTVVGEAKYYYKNGKLIERQLYVDGKMFYFKRYDSIGSVNMETVIPIFYPKKDTVSLGEEYEVEILFPFNLADSLTLYTGKLDKNSNLFDTSQIQIDNGVFKYSENSKKVGVNIIPFVVKDVSKFRDSLTIDGLLIKHVYYVK